MIRALIKFGVYALVLWLFMLVGLVEELSANTLLGLAAVLMAVNTLLRPIFVAVAMPFNLFTFGIASVFANLLSLVIANAIMSKPLSGFWVMLLIAFVVMLADDLVRLTRNGYKRLVVRSI